MARVAEAHPATELAARRWPWRWTPWLGGVFIAGIVALAAVDTWHGHSAALAETGRELEALSRVIAEQTARSLHTVDRVTQHIAAEHRSGKLDVLGSEAALHAYLRDQAVGLMQVGGLTLFDTDGRVRAVSTRYPLPDSRASVAGLPAFEALKAQRQDAMTVATVMRGISQPGRWVVPMGRRLERPDGSFAGAVAAAGSVEYFQNFYRDVRLDEGTYITLLHRDGVLIARHPVDEAPIGKRFELLDTILAARSEARSAPVRFVSPLDGVERFGAAQLVAGYPLAVTVTRDVSVALAVWRAEAAGTATRTLALALLATVLLVVAQRQFGRLDRARASLELSRERFALAAAGSEEGIWDWDVKGDRIYASARAREIFGLAPGPDVQPRDEWLSALRMHPDDVALRRQALDAHLSGKTPVYAGEYRVRGADGQFRWVRVRGLCVRDDKGQPLRMAGSVTDIDAQRRAEDALRLSEERLALAMTGSTGGHWVWDVQTDALFVSGTVNQLFGLPVELQVANPAEYFAHVTVHPEDMPLPLQSRRWVNDPAVTRLDFEYRILLPGSGESRWILTRAQCFRDAAGRALRVAGVSVDITERKRTEEALRLSQERFALAVAGSKDGVIDWDIPGDRMYTSERMLQMIGAPTDVTVRTRAEWMQLLQLHPQDRERHAHELQTFLASGESLREGEFRVRGADGGWLWVRLRNICVRDAEGRPVRLAGSVSDIDAYKRVEAALRESEERYALAMTGSNEGHWVWNIAAGLVYVSDKMAELLAIPGGAQEMPAEQYFAALPVHPDDVERVRDNRERHLAGETPRLDHEFRIVRPDTGELLWVHTRAQCFRDASGVPLRMAGATVDATQRKRAEELQRQSEERYALAVAGSDDGVWDWDFRAELAFESARARELQGLPPGPELQPLPKLLESLRVHPDDAPRRVEGIRAHLAGETPAYECEYRVRHDDGQYRWIRVRALCIRDTDGKPYRMAGSVSDIDAKRRTEEALRRSEERYMLAVAGSAEGLWDWDLASDSLFLSARAQELLWVQASEAQRPRREWIALTHYHPDDVPVVHAALSAHLRGATQHFKVEYRVLHHSGEYRWYRQRGIAVRNASGQPTRMAGSMEDITERKRSEAERERLEGQLRQAQKLEAIGTLAGGIAHDFNNILAAILGYGEMAQKDAAEGTRLRRHIDAAMSAGMRAKSLVERILAFSRSGMGERVPVHVQSVVAEALDAVAASLPAGISLEQQLAVDDAAVFGDPTQVHQVVLNLCANAVQAMKGSGTLTVTLERLEQSAPQCATCALAEGSYLRLSVRDTGGGIAPHVLDRIFDPFFTTKEIGVGTGLGLSLVHGIVSDLGGGIDVASRPGEGATFTVYLPWQSTVAAPAPADEDEQVIGGNGATVLLVDDEESLVRLGEEMIAGMGYEPVGFVSSLQALAAFRAAPARFDAVLSDEAMPEMTGSELAEAIRALRSDIPIVLMSGYVTPGLLRRAREHKVSEVLAKPLVARDIARCLAEALPGAGSTVDPRP